MQYIDAKAVFNKAWNKGRVNSLTFDVNASGSDPQTVAALRNNLNETVTVYSLGMPLPGDGKRPHGLEVRLMIGGTSVSPVTNGNSVDLPPNQECSICLLENGEFQADGPPSTAAFKLKMTLECDGQSDENFELDISPPRWITHKVELPRLVIELEETQHQISMRQRGEDRLSLCRIKLETVRPRFDYAGQTENWCIRIARTDGAGDGPRLSLHPETGPGPVLATEARWDLPLPLLQSAPRMWELRSPIEDLRLLFRNEEDENATLDLTACLISPQGDVHQTEQLTATVRRRLGEVAEICVGSSDWLTPTFHAETDGCLPPATPLALFVSRKDGALIPPQIQIKLFNNGFHGQTIEASYCSSSSTAPPQRLDCPTHGEDSRGYTLPPEALHGLDAPDASERTGTLRISIKGNNADRIAEIPLVLRLHRPKAKFLVCLDFGSSASAIWFGHHEIVDGLGMLLPLGQFVHDVGGRHDESPASSTHAASFVPSAIGLTPMVNWRARSDPYSYGDLSLALDPNKREDLNKLGADICVPPIAPNTPNSDGEDQAERILPDLKHTLLRRDGKLRIGHSNLNVEKLLTRVFEDFGAYHAPQALYLSDTKRAAADSSLSEATDGWFDKWLNASPTDIQVVATHPYNASPAVRDAYLKAATAFGNSFGRGAPPPPILVPEALSAAFFGIHHPDHGHTEAPVYACIDIGAGTFDASLVARIQDGGGWKILAHFGGMVGGHQLDRALAQWVRGSLIDGAEPYGLELRPDLLEDDVKLPRAILDARRTMTAQLKESNWSDGKGELRIGALFRRLDGGSDPREGRHVVKGVNGPDLFIDVAIDTRGVRDYVLVARLADLSGIDRPTDNMCVDDPRAIARLIGVGVPAMLAREIQRSNAAVATDVRWVITGRTALWPPIYSGIAKTLEILNAGQLIQPTPFPADEMKSAIVLGAAAIVRHDELRTEAVATEPVAEVFFRKSVKRSGAEDSSQIDRLAYLDLSDGQTVSFGVEYGAFLCHCMPGLDEEFNQQLNLTREEAIELFRTFGQSVTWGQADTQMLGNAVKNGVRVRRDGPTFHYETDPSGAVAEVP